MSDLGTTLLIAFHLVVFALQLCMAAYLVLLPSRHGGKLLWAASLVIGGSLIVFDTFLFAAPGAWWNAPLGRLAGATVVVQGLVGLALASVYPTRARRNEVRFWLVLAGATLLLAELVLWFVARDWIKVPGIAFRGTLQWHLLSPYGELGAVLVILAYYSAMRSSQTLDDRTRRGTKLVYLSLLAPTLLGPTVAVLSWAAWAAGVGGAFSPTALGTVVGDCCRIASTAWVLLWFVLPAWCIVEQSLRYGYHLPLLVVVAGALSSASSIFLSLRMDFPLTVALATVPAYATARHGAFGVTEVPPRAAYLTASAAAIAAFFLTSISVLSMDPESPLLLIVGVALGFAMAVFAVVIVLPRARAWASALASAPDGETTRRRLDPYRAALTQQMEEGLRDAELLEKLRPLRDSLGVSDREHAVLEYALGGGSEARASRGAAPGQLLFGRYRVAELLGKGGAGVTYLCHDERVRRDVVVKTRKSAYADAEGVAALLTEARALAKVRHPNVVTLHDVEQVGEEAFLIMEHVEGGSLAARLAQGPLPPDAVRRLAHDLLSALAAVHAAGLVHRDVKPSNVLFGRDGGAKLADFGIAHLEGFETTAPRFSGAQGAAGTIRYMSPEQARGRRVGPPSDLYSAAVTLFEAWTGAPYLAVAPSESAIELQMRIAASGGIERAPPGPPALRAWWVKALAPAPSERYASADEMRSALDDALGRP